MSVTEPLSTGLGPQDHAASGKAADIPGKPTGQFFSVAPIDLPSPSRPLPLQVRVTGPMTGSNLPIILLSHGHGPSNNLSSLNGYLPTSQFLAAHGFVVIQPTHLSSRSLTVPEGATGGPLYWQSRVQDMTLILDQLDVLEAAVPFIQGRLDREHIAIIGHSLGGHTAEVVLGLEVTDEAGEVHRMLEPRVKCGVLMGAIGRGGEALAEGIAQSYPFFAKSNFSTMTTPCLTIAGDKDDSKHLSTAGPAWHEDPFRLSPSQKDLLVLFDGFHIFGGVSGWDSTDCELSKEENPEMLATTLRMTLAYLRSQLYPGDQSWQQACKALVSTGLGRTESK